MIVNNGHSTARNLWFDVYLDPRVPPDVNQTCGDLGCEYRLSWFVDKLEPGQMLTLVKGDSYQDTTISTWPLTYTAGSHTVWGYVDSWGAPNPWGSVRESNEDNNRSEPVTFTVP